MVPFLIWWTIITLVIVIIIRCFYDKDEFWDGFESELWDSSYQPIGCIVTLLGAPGLAMVAGWDYGPLAYYQYLYRQYLTWCDGGKLKEAIAKLPPYELSCYNKIVELEAQRTRLQNELSHQENDNDPKTPTEETRRAIRAQVNEIESTIEKLWYQVSPLPMSDLPVYQQLQEASRRVADANEILLSADDPTVRMLRGNIGLDPKEVEKAREELRQM